MMVMGVKGNVGLFCRVVKKLGRLDRKLLVGIYGFEDEKEWVLSFIIVILGRR